MGITPAALKALVEGDLDNFQAAATPGGIEAQEAAGQKSFVESQTLPKDCPREQLESLGFVFGDDADDIFINVQFPDGWQIKPTDHSMHNDLIDNKDRKRGGIFYKAAFYDRSAHLGLTTRYSVSNNYELETEIQHMVTDCGSPIYETEKVSCEKYSDEYWLLSKSQEREVCKHIDDNYPEHKNPLAYWGQ